MTQLFWNFDRGRELVHHGNQKTCAIKISLRINSVILYMFMYCKFMSTLRINVEAFESVQNPFEF